jgi:hypothetical protein
MCSTRLHAGEHEEETRVRVDRPFSQGTERPSLQSSRQQVVEARAVVVLAAWVYEEALAFASSFVTVFMYDPSTLS